MSDVRLTLSKIDLDRVKRDAKDASKRSGRSYCQELNDIARKHGFETFENLQSKVKAERLVSSPRETLEPELEELLTWFRSRYTRADEVEKRVSPLIAKSLRDYQRVSGRSPFHTVDIGDEIDFGYKPEPFRIWRHPQALAAEMLLEAEGDWVSNSWLDSFRVRKGGFWGDGEDDLVGDRIVLPLFNEGGGKN